MPSGVGCRKLRLPAVDVDEDEDKGRDLPTRSSTRLSRVTVDIPKSAIAGVKGKILRPKKAFHFSI